jgi:hypothetical protein
MGSTDEFLHLLDEQSARIVAREVVKEASVDQVRLQRDQERREKWGRLRARQHRGRSRVGRENPPA